MHDLITFALIGLIFLAFEHQWRSRKALAEFERLLKDAKKARTTQEPKA